MVLADKPQMHFTRMTASSLTIFDLQSRLGWKQTIQTTCIILKEKCCYVCSRKKNLKKDEVWNIQENALTDTREPLEIDSTRQAERMCMISMSNSHICMATEEQVHEVAISS